MAEKSVIIKHYPNTTIRRMWAEVDGVRVSGIIDYYPKDADLAEYWVRNWSLNG